MALKRNHPDNTVSNCKKGKICDVIEPDIMNYRSVLSLKRMSTVSIATVLCKQSAIREHSMINKRSTYDDGSRFQQEIEKRILNNLALLPLPSVLKIKVSNVVRPIQLQLLDWIRHNREDLEYIDSVCWSNEGTINKIKTLKHLIDKDEARHVESFFKLACSYCSEENVLSLWNKLPEETKKHYLCSKNIHTGYDNHLLAYWIHNISSDSSELLEKIRSDDYEHVYTFNDSINNNMINLAIFTKNILALKYFWNKLTYQEISSNFKHWIQLTLNRMSYTECYQKRSENSDILYFLLSKTNTKTEQNEILQENSGVILNSLFCDWPWQRFLLPTINLLWENLEVKCYAYLLNKIALHINEKNTTEQLLSELWSDSPVNLKKCFIQYALNHKTEVFCNLLVVEKSGIIKAIFEYADLEDQKQIIFLLAKSYEFKKVVHSDKFHLLDDLCKDSLSQYDIKCLKNNIASRHFDDACFNWIERNEWDKLNAFLNWAFSNTEEVEHFKNEEMDTADITYQLLYHMGNYELVNKFLDWCFGSEKKIRKFKLYFAESTPSIFMIGWRDWNLFEDFVNWCFNSDEEIKNFKSKLSQPCETWNCVFSFVVSSYNFDSIESFMEWCFNSNEEKLKEFKKSLALSNEFVDALERLVENEFDFDEELILHTITNLFDLVSPLDEEVIVELKNNISHINFDVFGLPRKYLFRLLGLVDGDCGDSDRVDSDCGDSDRVDSDCGDSDRVDSDCGDSDRVDSDCGDSDSSVEILLMN